jgi:hypothetical protein
MKYEVTRDVVSDLWPLCQSGDASTDSQALIEAYLAEDGSFARELKESEMLFHAMPDIKLSPDAEARLLAEVQKRTRMKLLLLGGTIALVGAITIIAMGAAIVFMGIG